MDEGITIPFEIELKFDVADNIDLLKDDEAAEDIDFEGEETFPVDEFELTTSDFIGRMNLGK